MGSCYIKPDRDKDFYVRWSSVVDSPVAYGTRVEMLQEAKEDHGTYGHIMAIGALDRADKDGTSALGPGVPAFGAWDDDLLLLMEGGDPGFLRRVDLVRYLEAKTEEEIAAMVIPLDDED